MVDGVNVRVAEVYHNQKLIDAEVRALQAEAQKFGRATGQWLEILDKFHRSLKELGDVENWTEIIESDLGKIAGYLDAGRDAAAAEARAGKAAASGGADAEGDDAATSDAA